jgi:lipopolysaccharide transport system permease protein
MKHGITVYTPAGKWVEDSHINRTMTLEMLSEAWNSRGLIWRLFVRDFSARYRQSLLGIAWVVLTPILTMGMFLLMRNAGIFTAGNVGVPYPLYAMSGLAIWYLFASGVTGCASALADSGSLIAKIKVPMSSLVLSSIGQGLVDFLVRGFVIAPLFIWYALYPSPIDVVLSGCLLIPLIVFMLGCGFIFAIVGGFYRDAITALNLALPSLMLLTPILYPLPAGSALARMNELNPLYYLIAVPRDMILFGHSELWTSFTISAASAFILLMAGWRLLHIAQPKLAETI